MKAAIGFEEKLQNLIDLLNMYLTEKNELTRSIAALIPYEDWVLGGVAYYLADGGYSRIVSSMDNHCVFLTSNSRDEVKDRWEHPRALELRKQVDDLVKEQWMIWQSGDY